MRARFLIATLFALLTLFDRFAPVEMPLRLRGLTRAIARNSPLATHH